VPSNPFRANSSDAAARICRRRSGPFRNDFGFFVRAFARAKGFVISFQSVNDEEPGRENETWQASGFRSPRRGPQKPFQWIGDLYTFGAVLSRINQATDRRDNPF